MRREYTAQETADRAADYVLCVQECRYLERRRAGQSCAQYIPSDPDTGGGVAYCWADWHIEGKIELWCRGCRERHSITSDLLPNARRRRANAWRRLVRAVGE